MKKSFNLLSDSDWQPFLDYLLNLRGKGRYNVTIQGYRKKRSLSANAYYWSACVPVLASHFGYRPTDMHTAILGEYVGWEQREFRGKLFSVPRRTSTTPEVMDTMDFSGLIQTAQQIAAEEGIIILDPQEGNSEKETEPESNKDKSRPGI
jgi:hypothetical protein